MRANLKKEIYGLVVTVLLVVALTTVGVIRAEEADNCAKNEDPELVYKKEGPGVATYNGGPIVNKLVIKSEDGVCHWYTSDQGAGCYLITGLGMNAVTVNAVELPPCKGIDEVEFIMTEPWVRPTCKPTCTPTATPEEPTPTNTNTPTVTVTPSVTASPTPTNTNTPTATVTPSVTASPTPTPTNTPPPGDGPTPTPTPSNGAGNGTPADTPTPTTTGTPSVVASPTPVIGGYNPLLAGIQEAFGGFVLGKSTEMPSAGGEVIVAENLSSINKETGERIKIAAIGLDETIFVGEKIGDENLIGFSEIVESKINGETVLMGHNYGGAFEKLWKVKPGVEVEIGGEKYVVAKKYWVEKENLEILAEGGEEDVWLVTCSVDDADKRIVVRVEKDER